MKIIIYILFFIFTLTSLYSLDENVGMGTLDPDNTALLELFSVNQGFLSPRMMMAQRDLIGAPATGLLIHQLNNDPGYWYWDGIQWLRLATANVDMFVYGNGEEGQVAIWSTSHTITGTDDLFFDYTNTRLGVGTKTPRETLEIDGALKIGNTAIELPGTIKWTGSDFKGFDGTYWYSFTSGTLTGSGERGQVTYWSSPTSIAGTNDLFYDIDLSRLGIGTMTPAEKLHVEGAIALSSTSLTIPGNIRWTGSDFEGYVNDKWLSFTSNTLQGSGADGQITYWTSSTFISGSNDLFYDYTNTRIGIGTNTPGETLEIDGGMTIGNSKSVVPVPGTVRWTGDDFEGWNGTEWKSFTQSGAFGSGDPTQVAFWVTSRTLSGDDNLWWDATNKRLGVGTNAPEYTLDVLGTARVGGNNAHGWLTFHSEQGPTDYNVGIAANPSSTTSLTFVLPPDAGEKHFILASDGFGKLNWISPFINLGYYWIEANNILTTRDDWGIARYGNTLLGDTKKQINFGFSSTTGSAYSNILGGLNNTASASFSTVTGGRNNEASGAYSFIPGGFFNQASGAYSFAYGMGNIASGNYSVISQGQNLTLSGSGSYAFRGGGSAGALELSALNTFYVSDAFFHFNINKGNYDFRLDGDNIDNVLFVDASTDRVGIRNNSPTEILDVTGDIQMSNTNNSATNLIMYEDPASGQFFSSSRATTQATDLVYSLPVEHNVIHSGFMNDGFGTIKWASPQEITAVLSRVMRIITTNDTLKKGDIHLLVQNTSQLYITLPLASTCPGKEFFIKKYGLNNQRFDIVTQGSDRIDGLTSTYIDKAWYAILIVCDGTEWFIMTKYQGGL
jgi:hypothetical protein